MPSPKEMLEQQVDSQYPEKFRSFFSAALESITYKRNAKKILTLKLLISDLMVAIIKIFVILTSPSRKDYLCFLLQQQNQLALAKFQHNLEIDPLSRKAMKDLMKLIVPNSIVEMQNLIESSLCVDIHTSDALFNSSVQIIHLINELRYALINNSGLFAPFHIVFFSIREITKLNQEFNKFFLNTFGRDIGSLLVVPGEELICRFLMQQGLIKIGDLLLKALSSTGMITPRKTGRIKSALIKPLAIFLQACVFAAIHEVNQGSDLCRFLGGIWYGVIREVTGDIRGCILAHLFNNLGGLLTEKYVSNINIAHKKDENSFYDYLPSLIMPLMMVGLLVVYRGAVKIMPPHVQGHLDQTALEARPLFFSAAAAQRKSSNYKNANNNLGNLDEKRRKTDVPPSRRQSSSNASLRRKRMLLTKLRHFNASSY